MDAYAVPSESKVSQSLKYTVIALATFLLVNLVFLLLWYLGYLSLNIGGNIVQGANGYRVSSTGLVRSVSISGFVKEMSGSKVVVEDGGEIIEFETYKGTQFSSEEKGEDGSNRSQIRPLNQGDISIGDTIQSGLVVRGSVLSADVIIKVQKDGEDVTYDN